jgi:predicted permease
METLLQDIRYGVRMQMKSPSFAAIAVITLALGIGANTALFSVVNGVLLSPLPFPEPDQLVTLHENKPNFEGGSVSYPNFRDWQKDNHTFSSMALSRQFAFSLTGFGEAEQVNADFVSSDFFTLLGIKPAIGRTFAQDEESVGAGPVALISAGLWQRKFSSAPDILGKNITLDARDYTIAGVIPSSFHMAIPGFRDADVYAPIGQWSNPLLLERGAGLGFHGIARLKPGMTLKQAQADMDGVARNLANAFPDADKGITATPLKATMVGNVRPLLLVLLAAVGFVLLIACVNVANLLLARSTSRTREFAVRAALGATRARVVHQLLTESILLGLMGGGLGLFLAAWGTRAALGILPRALPRAEQVGLDSHVLLFTAAVSLLSGIVFGLTPALKTARPALHETLKQGRGTSGTHSRTQSVFVVVEMALALVLLIGAGLTIRSLAKLWRIDPGFNPHNVLNLGLSLPPSMMHAKPDAIRASFRDFDEKLAAVPGIQAVSQTWGAVPLGSDDEQLFWLEGQPKPANENDMNWAIDYMVETDYLKAMGIPLRRGRFFTQQDNVHSPLVVVVDEMFAQKFFPGQDALGKQWGLNTDEQQSLRAELYIPCMQMPDDFVALTPSGSGVIVRAATLSGLLESIHRASVQMSSQQVIFGAQTMDSVIADSLTSQRFSMILLVAFAVLALLLASVGIYGVISYVVGQRSHEIGIRMALGAKPGDILRLILGRGGRLAGLGVAVGLAAAFGLTRLMTKMLYGVGATDPLTFSGVAVLLTLVALAACYIPARRATRVDPVVTLRYE